eukprot:8568493-Pyramimonas_sp.AAC.1
MLNQGYFSTSHKGGTQSPCMAAGECTSTTPPNIEYTFSSIMYFTWEAAGVLGKGPRDWLIAGEGRLMTTTGVGDEDEDGNGDNMII